MAPKEACPWKATGRTHPGAWGTWEVAVEAVEVVNPTVIRLPSYTLRASCKQPWERTVWSAVLAALQT